MSQTAFAEIFNLKRAAVGAYEEERAEPKVEVFVMIARHFGIPVEDLICTNLQESPQRRSAGADAPGIPLVSADDHKILYTGISASTAAHTAICLPGIDSTSGLIAVEYGQSTLIVRELDRMADLSGTDPRCILAAGENGVRILDGTSMRENLRLYHIIYIIKRYGTQDFADAMLADISQRLERLERR